MVSPVTLLASAARNKAAAAQSPAVASCCKGVRFSSASKDGSELVRPAKWVRIRPGATAFTRMPGARARARDFVMVATPAFAAPYTMELQMPVNDADEA